MVRGASVHDRTRAFVFFWWGGAGQLLKSAPEKKKHTKCRTKIPLHFCFQLIYVKGCFWCACACACICMFVWSACAYVCARVCICVSVSLSRPWRSCCRELGGGGWLTIGSRALPKRCTRAAIGNHPRERFKKNEVDKEQIRRKRKKQDKEEEDKTEEEEEMEETRQRLSLDEGEKEEKPPRYLNPPKTGKNGGERGGKTPELLSGWICLCRSAGKWFYFFMWGEGGNA